MDRGSDPRELRKLLRPDNKVELARWRWGRQAVDVAAEFGIRAGPQEWAGVLGRLQPRLYSISSSPRTDPDAVSLTVSVIRYASPAGRPRKGVCSPFLADAEPGTPVPLRVQRAPHFRPPGDPAGPAVMIGPGTGIAPFIGFLEERRARGHRAPNWLFFGEQHRATDFYYEGELSAFLADGTLTRLDTAFSRDQRAKVYVQDRMREHGPRCGRGCKTAPASTSAAMPPAWPRTSTRPCGTSPPSTAAWTRPRGRLPAATHRRQALRARRVLTAPRPRSSPKAQGTVMAAIAIPFGSGKRSPQNPKIYEIVGKPKKTR